MGGGFLNKKKAKNNTAIFKNLQSKQKVQNYAFINDLYLFIQKTFNNFFQNMYIQWSVDYPKVDQPHERLSVLLRPPDFKTRTLTPL